MPSFLIFPTSTVLQAMCAACVLWFFIMALVRLVFHPLRQFPGPILAALSKWYEFYYDVILRGQFTFRIQELHRSYGPVVRITPEEIHIQDSDFWDELYARNSKPDKYAWMADRLSGPSLPKTHANTVENEAHRVRRAALNPLFSKRAIYDIEPLLLSKIRLVCKHLAQHAESSEPIDLTDVWSAFTGDIITKLAWGICKNSLASEGCKDNFHAAAMSIGQFSHFALHFPSVQSVIWPEQSPLFEYNKYIRERLSLLMRGSESEEKASHPTVFQKLLRSSLPPDQKTIPRVAAEAGNVVGAGVETVAWALSVASFHIINNPRVCRRLKQELLELVPDASAQPDLRALERAPYLAACAREGVRLSGGLPGRPPRLVNKELVYGQWQIPPRTPVSMSVWDVHMDGEIFPDSKRFMPERWLGNPKAPNGSPLERYFVGFGKGDRSCLGINLAQAELTMGLGAAFRQFDFELFETDETDVELAHDFALASPKLGSKGVRVLVRPTN